MFLSLTQDISNNQLVPLEIFKNQKLLVKNNDEYYLLSNICPHQNSLLTLKSVENKLICPYHGMEFNLLGEGCKFKLQKETVNIVNNMLVTSNTNFKFPVDLSHMEHLSTRIDQIKSNRDIVLDVFLDIDHIPVAHPGVYDNDFNALDVNNIQIEYFDNVSNQIVNKDNSEELGAIWTTIYPNTTIEWQQGALFVTVAIDTQSGCDVIIFKYKDSRINQFEWQLQDIVWEHAWVQDKNLCESIVALPESNLSELKIHHRKCLKNVLQR